MGTLDPPDLGPAARFCDLCYSKLMGTQTPYVVVEALAVCEPCLHRFSEEEVAVNKTIRLVGRGYYAEGRKDPGPNNL